jgi:hypothetical protein
VAIGGPTNIVIMFLSGLPSLSLFLKERKMNDRIEQWANLVNSLGLLRRSTNDCQYTFNFVAMLGMNLSYD